MRTVESPANAPSTRDREIGHVIKAWDKLSWKVKSIVLALTDYPDGDRGSEAQIQGMAMASKAEADQEVTK